MPCDLSLSINTINRESLFLITPKHHTTKDTGNAAVDGKSFTRHLEAQSVNQTTQNNQDLHSKGLTNLSASVFIPFSPQLGRHAIMTYPTSQPKMKHDLSSTSGFSENPASLLSSVGFSNSTELFRRLEEPLDADTRGEIKIGSVYSYSDAPDYPGPLSRALLVLGVADTSLSLVRQIVQSDEDDQHGVPDCLHKCTIAVQLADAKHMSRLEKRHQENSKSFCKFMKQLRKEEAVAIVAKDKHGRFGIIVPMGQPSSTDNNPSEILPEDCAASVYVGDVKEVLEYLATRNDQASTNPSAEETADDAVSDTWQPPKASTDDKSRGEGSWQPLGSGGDDMGASSSFSAPWETNADANSLNQPWAISSAHASKMAWGPVTSGSKRSFENMNQGDENKTGEETTFHANAGAAAADAFYSGLTRSLDTRADSYLYHMRSFNGWVKATQIQELDPIISIRGKPQPRSPLRVLDLACGKGGDLTKWTLHNRGIKRYVGIDVARGSLKDAAIRSREMRKRNKLSQAIFTVADLGADVPGRKKSTKHKHMQKLLTWSLDDEDRHESAPPEFKMKRGGGISENDRFDVVSIQFAIHCKS